MGDMVHCSFPSPSPLLARDLCILAKRRSSKLQCYSGLPLPHHVPSLLMHQQPRKDWANPALRTEGRSYKTIWSAGKVHGTEEARERGTCGIIQNCLKPPHHLQAPFICLVPPPFLQTASSHIHPSQLQLLSFSEALFPPASTPLYS